MLNGHLIHEVKKDKIHPKGGFALGYGSRFKIVLGFYAVFSTTELPCQV
jgi:hypothetical protein